jgi:hypothetical protein
MGTLLLLARFVIFGCLFPTRLLIAYHRAKLRLEAHNFSFVVGIAAVTNSSESGSELAGDGGDGLVGHWRFPVEAARRAFAPDASAQS